MGNTTLKEFIEQTMTDIHTGAKASDTYIDGSRYVKFKVLVSNTTKVDGGVKIYVLNAGAGQYDQRSTEIEFELPMEKQSEIDEKLNDISSQNRDMADRYRIG